MSKDNSALNYFQTRVGEYATWVRHLRAGSPTSHLHPEGDDPPLASLGRELELLANALTQREQEAQQLLDLIMRVEKGFKVEDVLNRVFDGFSGIIPFDRIGCAFLSADGSSVSAFWARSELGPVKISAGYSQPLTGSSLESIILTGRPRILNDLESYLREHPQSDSTRRIVQEGGRSSLTCPLKVDQRPIGFLFFTSHHANAYQDQHSATFLQIANQVSIALDKSRVFERMVNRNRELSRESKQLEIEATHDALTQILNRGAIMRTLEQALQDASQTHGTVGVIMVDIDHFKQINDSLGHDAGDEALKEVTRRLRAALRHRDRFGRYGGEEFLIVVVDVTSDILHEITERLRQAVAALPVALGDATKTITISIGATISSDAESPAKDLVAAADRALYAAKASGRNTVVIA